MSRKNDQKNEGEGSRTADQKYREGVRETLKTKDVGRLAEEAKEAVEHDTGELREAERIGRARADAVPEVETRMLDLAQLRDEVHVRMHLARSEAKEAFEKLESRWSKLMGKAGAVRDTSREAVSEVAAATELLIEELKEGYEKLRRELTR